MDQMQDVFPNLFGNYLIAIFICQLDEKFATFDLVGFLPNMCETPYCLVNSCCNLLHFVSLNVGSGPLKSFNLCRLFEPY